MRILLPLLSQDPVAPQVTISIQRLRLRPVTALLLLLVAMVGYGAADAVAQVPMSPRSLGTGGALLGATRGEEAVFHNPAHLGLSDSPRWSVSLAGASVAAELHGLSIGELIDLIEYDDLSDADRSALFAKIPADGARLEVDFRSPVGTAQFGRFGFGVGYLMVGGHSLSRDITDLILNGFEEGRIDYDVRDTRGDRATVWDFAVAYGTEVGPVSLGVTGHLLLGGRLVRTFMTDPVIDVAGRNIEVDFMGIRSRGGTGAALDFGAAYQLRNDLLLSGVITSAFSRIDWSDVVSVRELYLSREDFDANESIRTYYDRWLASERPITASDEALLDVTPQRFLQVDAQLPTTASLGLAWQPLESTDLLLAYSEELTDGRLGGDWQRRLAIGAEQRFWLLAVRAGVAGDLDGEHMITGGISFGPMHLGIGRLTGDRGDTSRSGWLGSFGLSTKAR